MCFRKEINKELDGTGEMAKQNKRGTVNKVLQLQESLFYLCAAGAQRRGAAKGRATRTRKSWSSRGGKLNT